MTPTKISNRAEEIISALKESRKLSLSERDDLIEIMTEARDGTNGLTVEEKTQANSVNIANLCYLYIRERLEGASGFWPQLFRLVERCRWQIVIIVLGAFALLAYHPEIAGLIASLRR